MERKLFLRSIGGLALVLCAVLVFGTASSLAIALPMDLTGVEVGWDTLLGYKVQLDDGSWVWPYAEYTFKANELPGEDWGWMAFCVQSQRATKAPDDGKYKLIQIPNDFNDIAVKMMDRFNYSNGNPEYTQRDYQLAIWYKLGVIQMPVQPKASEMGAIWLLAEDWDKYTIQGQYALAYSADYQNFMVRVPEPGTILLLGAGLIGLAGFRRFRKK